MLQYKYGELVFHDGGKMLRIDFEDSNYDSISNFLEADVTPFGDWIKEQFDKVLTGEEERIEAGGNATTWEIHRDKTRIDFLFPPDENDEVWCEVDTKELRALIDEWCEKSREFDKKHNKK